MTHTDTHTALNTDAIHAAVKTHLQHDRIHKLMVQVGSRSSATWRAVGYVVQNDKGLFATFADDRFEQVWNHWCAPKPGVVESNVVLRFAGMDGAKQVNIARMRVPQWLLNELRQNRRWERTLAQHAPTTGRHLPGGPRKMGSMWARVERCMYQKSNARARR